MTGLRKSGRESFKLFPFVSIHVQVFGSLYISAAVHEGTYWTYQSNTKASTSTGIFYNKPEISGGAEAALSDWETKPDIQPWMEKEQELVPETSSFLSLMWRPKE